MSGGGYRCGLGCRGDRFGIRRGDGTGMGLEGEVRRRSGCAVADW